MNIGLLFSILHIIGIIVLSLFILFINNKKLLFIIIIISLGQFLCLYYFGDCCITLLEKKYNNDKAIVDITKYILPHYKNNIEYTSTIAYTVTLIEFFLLSLKLFMLTYFHAGVEYLNNI